jgi:hypothetical protein
LQSHRYRFSEFEAAIQFSRRYPEVSPQLFAR